MSLEPGALPTTLGGQFKRHLPAYLAGGVLLGVFQLALNRIDWLSKAAIDDVFGGAPEQVTRPAMMIFGLAALSFACRVGSRWFIFNAGRDAEYELRALLLHRLHRLGAAFYRTMSAGEIMSRSSNDLQQVRLLLGFGILNIVNVVFAFASALEVMVNISVRLTLVSFVMLPVMVLVTRSFSRKMFARTRHNQETLGKLSEVLQTNLAGVRVVRSFALEERERSRFAAANDAYLEASLSLARLRGLMFPAVGAASTLGVLAFFWYGASLLEASPEDGGITRGDFFAFWLAYGRMTWPMIAFGFSISVIQRGRAGYARLAEIFRAVPEITDGALPSPKEVTGSISVRGLSFSYGERKVVDDVSFDVPAGKSVALVGRTGSGKSTIAMLLARLLPTPPGAVFVDGEDVCDLPLAAVRANVGYAQQDAFLFSTTVLRNVGFSLDDCESEDAVRRIRLAAREAQVLEEALGLPEQLETVVGERGVQLSGGQKQRIALARALVREPKVLVLDDPLSAVDAKTEAAILDAIDRQAAERTVILVTHRVAAASRCDEVVVLDEGRIVQRGTHDELVRQDGLYAAFAEEQSAKSALDELESVVPSGSVPA
ncbi:MAG: ABC transporter ATP-binding protein [Labilithrix sp.]|nr:ABC transporter ATP-binding protein [Labilithrix sp.]MCW5833409.1 ABC transporter ATP-binding protein [Labilithrix sp.]